MKDKEQSVLVIDDEPAVLRILALVLDDFGYETYVAADAESALQGLRHLSPDAVVCDVKLPGMDGAEFTHRVRELPGLSETPIVLVSAYDEPPGHSADWFVAKPLDPFDLAEIVRGSMARRRTSGEVRRHRQPLTSRR